MPKTTNKKSAKKSSNKKNKKGKDKSPSKDNTSEISNNSDNEYQRESPNLKLHKIILENFKSFLGRNEIGYFQDFSVVLGPNGSGKSNIIDALSFVFGLNAQQMRTRNLKELIYHPHKSNPSTNKAQNCSVEIIFKTFGQNEKQKDNSNEENEISFKRTVNSNGSSSFYFNNKKVTQEEYSEKFIEYSIPVNSMFFILGQGGVDSLLSSKRNKIEQIIEILSGSYKYKEKYDELVKTLDDKNNELNLLSSQINSIKLDKNKIKTKIENKGLYKEHINKIQSLMKKIISCISNCHALSIHFTSRYYYGILCFHDRSWICISFKNPDKKTWIQRNNDHGWHRRCRIYRSFCRLAVFPEVVIWKHL